MTSQEILSKLPYKYPFLFVDEIVSVDDNGITGTYTYRSDLPFYEGHFKDNPVTPGVILTETMAQIGLVAHGVYILQLASEFQGNMQVAFTSADVHFYKPVFPEEKVFVKSVKNYFRFNKLKSNVEMTNEQDELVCRGTLAGLIKTGI